MAPALLFFPVFVLATALHIVFCQKAGFLSIDCGLEDTESYPAETGIVYVPDGPYVDTGENHRVSMKVEAGQKPPRYKTLRSFPSGERNCYMLPTVAGAKYFVRTASFYGNYDGKDSSSTLRFDLHLGASYWETVYPERDLMSEAVFVAWASWAPVCLVNTGHGTPFVSVVELRKLGGEMYPAVVANQSMRLVENQRISIGSNKSVTRYPDDTYDRRWLSAARPDQAWKSLSTASPVKGGADYAVPSRVMQTAVEAASNDTTLAIPMQFREAMELTVLMHFADFQSSQLRRFNVAVVSTVSERRRGGPAQVMLPPHLSTGTLHDAFLYRPADGACTVALTPTADSDLPPMINAFEVYTAISQDSPMTFPRDFDIIMAIKIEYGIKKNWMGDPCFPVEFAWYGVKCSNVSGNKTARIISLDLSYSNLHGAISSNFTLLTALEYLNLSCNQLNGPIPDSFRKSNTGSFVFSFDSDGDMCNKTINQSLSADKSKRPAIFVISVVVPVMAIAALILVYLIWRQKKKPKKHENASASRNNHGDAIQIVQNRQFTYKELEKITSNFEQPIGHGGFGPVYYGCLEDGIKVAVKMCSDSSSYGLDQFLAEVQSLTKVYHKNLVSLIGYCWEKNHLALIYEYMAQGSLSDHLRGNNGVSEGLNWRTRIGVVVEAAQGLDYLHKGCSLPIIHRDVKSSNILLSQNLQAKIADFGLSKSYLSDTQSYISATPAGSAGYMDPEYFHTGRLTESSDVYSFGIVLLEIVTGEPPILQGLGHIVQRVKNKIAAGNINLVADARFGGAYEVSSMWKVVDIALLCTRDIGAQRPTMAIVVAQLKDSLALEETRANSSTSGTTGTISDSTVSSANLGPLAR